jgi:hypothetical protein
MMFSISFSSRLLSIIFTVIICLSGCAGKNNQAISTIKDIPAVGSELLVAFLPPTNLSSTPVPLEEIRQLLTSSFKQQGLKILPNETLERFIIKHRIRYLGGLDETKAADFRYETGADAVLITSVDFYSEGPPPKVGLTCRLVSTGNNPEILWMDGVGLAGDDSIGILELSLIEDPRELLNKAARHLSTSLVAHLSGRRHPPTSRRTIIKFWPKIYYLSPVFEPEWKYTVAVVPFFNLSENRFAGETMALHFVRQLLKSDNFTVIEPGIIRHLLLQMRITMNNGISLADSHALFRKLDADLILTGKVFDYQDYEGISGKAVVGFSALLIGRRGQEVVWSCKSHNEGDYGVLFFDWGRMNTAHVMASEMVVSALETLAE